MRVICIKNSAPYKGDNVILVHKYSIYNVIRIVRDYEGIWYQLLETGNSIHHISLFKEINDLPTEKEFEKIALISKL